MEQKPLKEGICLYQSLMSNNNIIDIPVRPLLKEITQTNIYVIAGGPCSGKTSVIKALRKLDFIVEYEPAELLLQKEISMGRKAEKIRKDPFQWQQRVARADYELFTSISTIKPIFVDTSMIETWVFAKRAGIDFGDTLKFFIKNFRFRKVFFLQPLPFYQNSEVRMEDQVTALSLSEEILEAYREFGYAPHQISPVSIENRIDQIMREID